MILTCPECATRYFVEDERLGAIGRTVRCAACGSAWRAHADEPLELVNTTEGAIARAPGEPLSFKPVEPPALEDLPAPELPKAFRAKAEQQRRMRQAAAAGVVWAGMACAFVALFAASYFMRTEVVRMFPRAAGAYAMANIKVNPTGLEFRQVKAVPAPDGLAAVTVSGVVQNVDDETHASPPLRVTLLDKAKKPMASRVVMLPQTPIAPGKTMAFSVALPDPDASAADVDLVFALELQPKPAKAAKLTKAALRGKAPTTASTKAGAAHAAPAHGAPALRPRLSAETHTAVEAQALPATDPYALDSHAPKALSAPPHG